MHEKILHRFEPELTVMMTFLTDQNPFLWALSCTAPCAIWRHRAQGIPMLSRHVKLLGD